MSIYGVCIETDQQKAHQFNHETGAFIRTYGTYDPTWTPANSNFDVTTGLPTAAAISATGTSNLCSVAGGPSLVYLADLQTCRVLAIEPASGSLYSTFGGRRGIGAGKIEPDTLRRSVVAVGNSKVFLTDNAGDFVVQYSSAGVFEAEYSISGWAAALSLSFDQVMGWAYDTARGIYWALAQSSTTCYLFSITSAGVATSTTIDLTARLTSTLGITVGGHSGSPAERVRTRGLAYHNGRLFFWSEGRVIRIDLANTDGDQLVDSRVNDVGPGTINSAGTELTYVLRDQLNGSNIVKVITLSTLASRTYGPAAQPPTGTGGQVGGAWDVAVVSTTEDPSPQTSRDLTARARITAVTQRLLQIRAAIRNTVTRTLMVRARILQGIQRQLTVRARIEEPTTVADAVMISWTLEDELGSYSRGLQLETAGRAGFQVGDTLTLYAGYDQTRVRLGHFEIDEIDVQLEPDSEIYHFSCREQGVRSIDSKLITKVWQVQFPRTNADVPSVPASRILSEAAVAAGVTLGAIEFPDYPLYANFVAQQESIVQIAQKLMEPWSLFPSNQTFISLRENVLTILQRDWKNPPSNGYRLERRHLKSLHRRQLRYIQSPNLTAFTDFIVKGTMVTLSILDELGPQTKVEYFRQETQGDVTGQSAASVGSTAFAQEWSLLEVTSIEETWGDKVLSRTEDTYATVYRDGVAGVTRLTARTIDTYLYFEPAGPLGLDQIQVASAGPSPLALLYQTNSVRSGLEDGVFGEKFRAQTNYFYDHNNQVAAEAQSSSEFNTDTNRWELKDVTYRTHSQTTGGSVRVHRVGLAADGGQLSLDSVDAQQVGGSRPDLTATGGRFSVVSFQAIAPNPQVLVDISGTHIVDPGGVRFVWSFESNYLGQNEVEQIHDNAVNEKALQVAGYRWDLIDGTSILNPNIYSGQVVSIEISSGVFKDYWLESISHSFGTDEATTKFTAKRLTLEEF